MVQGGLVLGRLGLCGLGARRHPVRAAFERGFLRRDECGGVHRPLARSTTLGAGLRRLPALFVGLVLRPDRVEFHLHHAGRHREIIALGELVEETALQPLAGNPGVVPLQALANLLAQLGERLEPDCLRQLVIDGRRQAMAHLLYGDLEHPLLAGHVGVAVIRGKGDVHLAGFAGADAFQLIGEAGEQPGGAELDLAAFDIGDENIAFFGRPLDRFRFALPFGDSVDRPVDIFVRHVDDQLFQAER